MKTFYHLVAMLVLLALMAIPLTGCVKIIYSTASLSEATMTTGVDKNFRPLDITSVFTSDLPEIFCSVKLSNAPPDTEIKADWIYIRGEVEDLKDYLIDSWSAEAEGTRYIHTSVTRPNKGWPNGDYKVVWYIDGMEKLTVPFKIQISAAPTASLSEATMCKSVDAQSRPVDKTDVFSPTDPIIYCSVKVSNAPDDTEVKAQWIYVRGEAKDVTNYSLGEAPVTTTGTRYIKFSYEPPTKGYVRGDYVVKLFLDGKEKLAVPFKVQ